ncbi:hypothetical protein N836_09105 [Leptolyngbya sp. Heron Island J]|uniref:hypothetical protein n=1 Tax=Leptolyngbya sp. Heron Island J TaxID=1385935 RepID=UPI0003B9B5BD|nr:hypothetical protein [Leptolyngbya sp. Heron Island J]ESA36030.1 hypothetical protein N836_09105 [Leptolyngbya sp. Heron Island J]
MNLSPDDIKQLWEAEHYTPKGYLHCLLLAHRPPGEPWKIESVAEFCQRWNFPERQFYKAKAALVADDLIDETITDCVELTARPLDTSEVSMPALGELIAETLNAQPEQPTDNSDWATWYDEARRRGLVLASQRQGETTMVCLVDEQWVPFEELRWRSRSSGASHSWDELEAQLKPMMVDAITEAVELTPEQQKILATMSRLTGG